MKPPFENNNTCCCCCCCCCLSGESGLGKTTFINNLVSSYTTTGKTHDGSSTSLADFQVREIVIMSVKAVLQTHSWVCAQ
jgi:septin family protein